MTRPRSDPTHFDQAHTRIRLFDQAPVRLFDQAPFRLFDQAPIRLFDQAPIPRFRGPHRHGRHGHHGRFDRVRLPFDHMPVKRRLTSVLDRARARTSIIMAVTASGSRKKPASAAAPPMTA